MMLAIIEPKDTLTERTIMKIAIPSEADTGFESLRSINFAHAPFYTIVTFDDGMAPVETEIVASPDLSAVSRDDVIDHIANLGVDGILTVGMSMQPFLRFINANVMVYSDDRVPTVGEAVERFSAGQVPKLNGTCCSR